jgi:lipopolysaccharide/colanic/teichoic acid biosynthesis glycosyltransferase
MQDVTNIGLQIPGSLKRLEITRKFKAGKCRKAAAAIGSGHPQNSAPLPRRVLIMGSQDAASLLVEQFQRHLPHVYAVIGIVASELNQEFSVDKAVRSEPAGINAPQGAQPAGEASETLPVIGQVKDIAELSRDLEVDEVLIADYFAPAFKKWEVHLQPLVTKRQVTEEGPGAGVSAEAAVYRQPSFDQSFYNRESCNQIVPVELENSVAEGANESWPDFLSYHGVKRFLDIVISCCGLLLTAPLLLLLGLLHKWTAPGPIFFTQERVGLNGRRFPIYKLRTMRIDAEKETGPVLAQHRDNRCTPLGVFLRATKIDELPQLYNVLRGDMSLVGPRPERPVFVDMYERYIPRYSHRHHVRPGLTGLAQVNGDQLTHVNVKLHYDLMYVQRCSFLLDLSMLARTPIVILKGMALAFGATLRKPAKLNEQAILVQV